MYYGTATCNTEYMVKSKFLRVHNYFLVSRVPRKQTWHQIKPCIIPTYLIVRRAGNMKRDKKRNKEKKVETK